jgi:asparagine synthase (glutamine-hydrolysing)
LSFSFIGQFARPGAPAPAQPILAGFSLAGLNNGFVAHQSAVICASRGDTACVAVGRPRFSDPQLARIATEEGIAAAWIRAFTEHPDTAPSRVRGRFAVALVDGAAGVVRLATDRFGTWPICYAETPDGLHFSDRADTFPGARRALSEQALFDYLYFHVIPAPQTVFAGVRRLPAAHLLNWSASGASCNAYWQPRFQESRGADLESCKGHFLEIIRESVKREAAIGEVGAFLSGGTDSSTVSGMLCKVLGRPARTYSIGFDASGYDEMDYARIAARHFGTDHHEYYVTPEDLIEGIPKIAVHYDQPFGNSSAVPAWICARRAREDGVDTLLAGDGGDELFGGNTRYARQRLFGWYGNIPAGLRCLLIEPMLGLPGMDRVPLVKKAASYVAQARIPMPDRMETYNMLERLGVETIFEADFLAGIDAGHPRGAQRQTWNALPEGSLVNRMLAFDWKYTLSDNDLPKVVGSTGLAGVEVAFPLLCDELVDFSTTLPTDWKLRGQNLRWFFKEALRGFLPDEIIAKKKHGFGLPFGLWACKHPGLKALAHDTLAGFKARGIVRPAFIDALLDHHLPAHPGYYGELVWILIMAELWLARPQSSAAA